MLLSSLKKQIVLRLAFADAFEELSKLFVPKINTFFNCQIKSESIVQ